MPELEMNCFRDVEQVKTFRPPFRWRGRRVSRVTSNKRTSYTFRRPLFTRFLCAIGLHFWWLNDDPRWSQFKEDGYALRQHLHWVCQRCGVDKYETIQNDYGSKGETRPVASKESVGG